MGTVIAKTAAADDIVRDAQTTHEQGVARGGRIQEVVENRLAPVLLVLGSILAERTSLHDWIVTLRAARDAAHARAEAVVAELRVSRDRDHADRGIVITRIGAS